MYKIFDGFYPLNTDHIKTPQNNNNNLETGLTLSTKINSKWNTDLNVKCETIKLLQDNIGEDLDALSLAMTFLMQYQRHTSERKNR